MKIFFLGQQLFNCSIKKEKIPIKNFNLVINCFV